MSVELAAVSSFRLGSDPDAPAGSPNTVPENPSYDGSFTLEWDAVTGALGYRLEQCSADCGDESSWAGLGSLGAVLSYQAGDTVPLSAGAYQYRIRACADAGCTALGDSAALSVTVYELSAPALSIDEALSDDGGYSSDDGSYTLSWGSAEGAVSYEIREQEDGGAEEFSAVTAADAGSSPEHAVSGKETADYSYSIRVCGERGVCSEWSGALLYLCSL